MSWRVAESVRSVPINPLRRLHERWPWLVLLAAIWWILADTTAFDAWAFGLATILGIVWLLPLPTPRGIRLTGLLRFAGFFIVQSLLAGVDVARRALSPRPGGGPLDPAIIEYRPTLPPERGLGLFIGVISLLPGTLSITREASLLRVHVLDAGQDNRATLVRVEQRVADVFGVDP